MQLVANTQDLEEILQNEDEQWDRPSTCSKTGKILLNHPHKVKRDGERKLEEGCETFTRLDCAR